MRIQETVLREAGLIVKNRTTTDEGEILEAEATECPGMNVLMFDAKEEGLNIGIRAELPRTSELVGLGLDSDKAMAFLGSITSGLASEGLQAELLTGMEGVEAVLISAHLCPGRLDSLKSQVVRIARAVSSLSSALAETEPGLLERVRMSVKVPISSETLVESEVNPAIVPSFDEGVRDRLLKEATQRKT